MHPKPSASDMEPDRPRLRFVKDNKKLLSAIGDGFNVAGATAFFWARPDAANAVDVLFVDEAAQMSLANVLAVSHAARTVVLLGDPPQLEQPMKAAIPRGRTSRRCITCSAASRRSRRTAACSSKRPGGSTPTSAASPRNSSIRGGCGRAPGWKRSRSGLHAASPAPASFMYP